MNDPIQGGSCRGPIVLVEKDEATLSLLSEVLGCEADYQVISVDRPSEAYEVICRARPSLVVADLWLGSETSGLELADRLAANGHTRDIPVLFVSAVPGAPAMLAGRRNTHFLAKPFDIDELVSRVASACGRRMRPH